MNIPPRNNIEGGFLLSGHFISTKAGPLQQAPPIGTAYTRTCEALPELIAVQGQHFIQAQPTPAGLKGAFPGGRRLLVERAHLLAEIATEQPIAGFRRQLGRYLGPGLAGQVRYAAPGIHNTGFP